MPCFLCSFFATQNKPTMWKGAEILGFLITLFYIYACACAHWNWYSSWEVFCCLHVTTKTKLSSPLLWYKWACFRINIAIFMYDKRSRHAIHSLAHRQKPTHFGLFQSIFSARNIFCHSWYQPPYMLPVITLPTHITFPPLGIYHNTGAQLKMTFSLDNYTLLC